MISVSTALERAFALLTDLPGETVPLAQAAGRILASPVVATRDQPPFPSSAMDGYAVIDAEVVPGMQFTVIGTSAAGHAFAGTIGRGEAVRIFTGAPVPEGADRVIIQEDVSVDGPKITLSDSLDSARHLRPKGTDFTKGATIEAPRLLGPNDIALLAAMNIPDVPVVRRPVIALMATGDELVMPGEVAGPDQIIASNSFGLKALAEAHGAEVRLLPIARDNARSLEMAFDLARGADLVVTIGGASVGDHDLVGPVAERLGATRSFYKVAMRPGKPLMAGHIGDSVLLGLPGNPVSSMVCGHIFMVPMLRAMLGLGAAPAPRQTATLAEALAANGPREHYMRATVQNGQIRALERQDSSLLSVLSQANALLVRPVGDPACAAGKSVEFIAL